MTRRLSKSCNQENINELMKAASECNVRLLRKLFREGAATSARDKQGKNVIYHAFANTPETKGRLENESSDTFSHTTILSCYCLYNYFGIIL